MVKRAGVQPSASGAKGQACHQRSTPRLARETRRTRLPPAHSPKTSLLKHLAQTCLNGHGHFCDRGGHHGVCSVHPAHHLYHGTCVVTRLRGRGHGSSYLALRLVDHHTGRGGPDVDCHTCRRIDRLTCECLRVDLDLDVTRDHAWAARPRRMPLSSRELYAGGRTTLLRKGASCLTCGMMMQRGNVERVRVRVKGRTGCESNFCFLGAGDITA